MTTINRVLVILFLQFACLSSLNASARVPHVTEITDFGINQFERRMSSSSCFVRAPAGNYEFSDVIEHALCQDAGLRAAMHFTDEQLAEIDVLRSGYYPKLRGHVVLSEVKTSTRYSQSDFQNQKIAKGFSKRYLHLEWLLFDFGLREAGLRRAQQKWEVARSYEDIRALETFVSVANLYFKVLVLQRHQVMLRRATLLAAENLEAADAKFSAGVVGLTDRQYARAALARANLLQSRGEGALKHAEGVLNLRMGFSPDSPLHLTDHLGSTPTEPPPGDIAHLISRSMLTDPGTVIGKANLEIAKSDLDESLAAGLPKIKLVAGSSDTLTRHSDSHSEPRRVNEGVIGLEVEIPLFDGFESVYKARRARANIAKQQAALLAHENELAVTVWTSYQNMQSESKTIRRSLDLIDNARSIMALARGRYKEGVGSMSDLIHAQNDLSAAELQYISSLSNYWSARFALAVSLGKLDLGFR